MSAYNNNSTSNNTSSGLEGRTSNLESTGLERNNLEDAYNRHQPVSNLVDDNGFDSTKRNNLEDTYNRPQPQEPLGQLNENHGIAASGLNDAHTHSNIPSTHGASDSLNYSGAPIADTNKIEQDTGAFGGNTYGSNTTSTNNPFDNNNSTTGTHSFGNSAGQDLNSQTNRHAGTGIPPVNTAEHVRRNAAEEAIAGGNDRFNEQNSHVSGASTGRGNSYTSDNTHTTGTGLNSATAGATTGATALAGDHGASQHNKNQGGDVGLDDKARLDSHHDITSTSETTGERHAGIPQKEGLLPKHSYHADRDVDNRDNDVSANNDDDGKPSAGDKIKGKVEKLVGKITGNEEKVVKGEERAQGNRV